MYDSVRNGAVPVQPQHCIPMQQHSQRWVRSQGPSSSPRSLLPSRRTPPRPPSGPERAPPTRPLPRWPVAAAASGWQPRRLETLRKAPNTCQNISEQDTLVNSGLARPLTQEPVELPNCRFCCCFNATVCEGPVQSGFRMSAAAATGFLTDSANSRHQACEPWPGVSHTLSS